MSHLLDGLNAEQARAVTTLDGPLLILAGAGSGKTRVLTRRIAYLLEQRYSVAPWNILAVTFTNKAAKEMKERLHQLIGESANKLALGTFHSICLRILRQEISVLEGFNKDFAIWDDDAQLKVLKEILKDRSINANPKDHSPNALRTAIDRAKNDLKGPADLKVHPSDPLPKVYALYQKKLKAANALDFNDIINKVIAIWEQEPAVLDHWRRKYRYVMVDEYQDTNPAQFYWLRLLTGGEEQNLAVVGDDDQSIYSFRGADIRNILDFEKHFPGAAVIKLEQNYRSTSTILQAASGVVKNNQNRKEKTLHTNIPGGEPLRIMQGVDDTDEASKVVGEMRRLLRQYKPSDMAIIFRTNSYSRPFEQALSQAALPYVLVGGHKFYERKEVRDILAYVKLILNPSDDMAFLRIVNVPARGLGDKSIAALQEEADAIGIPLRSAAKRAGAKGGRSGNAFAGLDLLLERLELASRSMPAAAFIDYVARETGYLKELDTENTEEARGRIDNIRELERAAVDEPVDPEDPLGALRSFVDRASLSGQADELPGEGGGPVTLLTAHLAKGLEFPVVFVVGLVNGLFPHARAEREIEKEEERRLFYVALTRARERLYLSYPARRRFPEGGWADSELSQFVREIPADAVAASDRAWLPRAGHQARPAPVFPSAPPRRIPPPAKPSLPTWLTTPAPKTAGPLFNLPASPPKPAGSLFSPPATSPSAAPPAPRNPLPAPSQRANNPEEDDEEEYRTMVPESPDSFREGTKVYHPLLGLGRIVKREGLPFNPRLTIHFQKHGPRAVFAIAAGLEIVL